MRDPSASSRTYEWCDKDTAAKWHPPDAWQRRASFDRWSGRGDSSVDYSYRVLSFNPRPQEFLQVDPEPDAKQKLLSLARQHFQTCSTRPGTHTTGCNCMVDARRLLLDLMKLQLQDMRTGESPDWCLKRTDSAIGIPWFFNYCLNVAKSEGEFGGKLTAGGAKAMMQLRAWDSRALPNPQPIAIDEPYLKDRLQRFWDIRGLLPKMQREYSDPFLDKDGCFTYCRRSERISAQFDACRHFGLFQHGTRMDTVASIAQTGLSESKLGSTDRRFWGCRILGEETKHEKTGVYLYNMGNKRAATFGNGYSVFTHMFGDGVYWSPSLTVIADFDQRVSDSNDRGQVVIPSKFVCIVELRIKALPYRDIPNQAIAMPVWVPELESAMDLSTRWLGLHDMRSRSLPYTPVPPRGPPPPGATPAHARAMPRAPGKNLPLGV